MFDNDKTPKLGRPYKWINTNRLLWRQKGDFNGLKTGITPNAGPCLAVSFCPLDSKYKVQLVIVILSSQNMDV